MVSLSLSLSLFLSFLAVMWRWGSSMILKVRFRGIWQEETQKTVFYVQSHVGKFWSILKVNTFSFPTKLGVYLCFLHCFVLVRIFGCRRVCLSKDRLTKSTKRNILLSLSKDDRWSPQNFSCSDDYFSEVLFGVAHYFFTPPSATTTSVPHERSEQPHALSRPGVPNASVDQSNGKVEERSASPDAGKENKATSRPGSSTTAESRAASRSSARSFSETESCVPSPSRPCSRRHSAGHDQAVEAVGALDDLLADIEWVLFVFCCLLLFFVIVMVLVSTVAELVVAMALAAVFAPPFMSVAKPLA